MYQSFFALYHYTIIMNIQNLVDLVKTIALDDIEVKSFYVGNNWDMSAGKGDIYPNLWLEFPILVDYTNVSKLNKQYTFSIDIITLAKPDDLLDEIHQISHMEELGDKFLQYLKQDRTFNLIDVTTGLSIKNINADNAVGIRLDIRINTPRVCLT